MSNLIFYGSDTIELAKKYGTPLYVMSEDYIVDRCREIREDFLGNMITQWLYMPARPSLPRKWQG